MAVKVCLVVLNNFKNDSRVLKEAISLDTNGYQVLVLAMFDSGQLEEELIKGIQVRRIPLKSRSLSKSKPIQLIKYFEFLTKAYSYAKNFDIIHCNDLNALPIGVLCKILNKKKIVYDAHEYEINHKPNESKTSIKLKYYLEKFLINLADKVITVSESIANEYVKLYNITKPTVVLNTPNFQDSNRKNIFREKFHISKHQTIFLYQGNLSNGRGIEFLLGTFNSMWLDYVENEIDNCPVIIFLGYGFFEDQIIDVSKTVKNVFFHPAVSYNEIFDFTSSADFGISMIEDVCLSYRFCLPNKLFEYLMADIPIIVSDLFEMKRFVKNNKVGIIIKNNSIDGIKEAIKNALISDKKDFILNIKKVKRVYNWEEQEKFLLKVYKELI